MSAHASHNGRFTIGVLVGWQVYHTHINSFIEGVFNGIQAAADLHNAKLLFACGINPVAHPDQNLQICPAWPDPSSDSTFVPVGPWNTDALLVISPLLSAKRSAYIRQLIQEGHPVLFLGSAEDSPSITYDHRGGVLSAMAHLAEHGHQRIAFIAGHPNGIDRDSNDRLQAYLEGCRLYHLDQDPELVVYGHHSVAGGRTAMETLLSRNTGCTALIASNDESAVGAMHVCHREGIRIPDDLAMLGFDNRLETAALEPPLSTIQIPLFEAGFRACDTLMQHLRGTALLDTLRNEMLPVRLVLRESCGCNIRETKKPRLLNTVGDLAGETEDIPSEHGFLEEVVEQVSTDVLHLSRHEIQTLAEDMLDAFAASIRENSFSPFLGTLLKVLQHTEQRSETPFAWQNAISCIEAALPQALGGELNEAQTLFARSLLFEAQTIIGKRIRKHQIEYIIDSDLLADQVGEFSAYLSSTMDEAKILDILANQLPSSDDLTHELAEQIDLVYLEQSADQLSKWSVLATQPHHLPHPIRFETTHFPPEGLYDATASVVALLPLVLEERQIGYIAFKNPILRICASVVRGIGSALHTAKLYQRAVAAQQMAEEANQMKSRFLSTVSHELGTPLSVIVGSSDVLLQDVSQDSGLMNAAAADRIEDLRRIQASARHLKSLVSDVLDITRSEIGHLQLNCEIIELSETLYPVLQVAQQMVESKGLTWSATFSAHLPRLWGDKVRLRQVVLNLVSNAAKFTDVGEVSLSCRAHDGVIVIEVADTGVGIPSDEQDLIFGEFQQSARTVRRGDQGLGLGLTICRRLVDLHGGSISVASLGEEGKGSTFRVLLPTADAKLTSADKPDDQSLILVVDDDPLARRTNERILFSQLPNTRVITAHNGSEALEAIGLEKPDLILLDLIMPELDGFGVIESMREHPSTRGIPVIVLSGSTLGDNAMKRLSKGVAAVLNKGMFSAEEIISHVERALRGSHRSGNATQMLVRSAMAYLHENYASPIAREDIAGFVNVNEDYLTACFQRELGIPPITYLNRYRINCAKILMATTSKSLTDIALDVGFSSSTYFSRVFRRETGISPSEYRAPL